MLVVRFLIVFIFLFFCLDLRCQQLDLPQTIRFKNYDNSSGLPGETVRAIYQDTKGLIWLGVEYKGLVAFDGTEFEVFNNSEDSGSLSSNVVDCIAEDADGNLWIGTNNGLNKKINSIEKFSSSQFTRFYSGDSTSIPHNMITSLLFTSRNELLVGTREGLCVYLGGDQFRTINLNGKSGFFIQSILEIDGGKVLIGTNKGLFLSSGDFSLIRGIQKEKFESEKITEINAMCPDELGRIWIGTDRGLFIYDQSEETIFSVNEVIELAFSAAGIDHIFRDQTGRMWIGTISNGLYIFHPKADKYAIITASSLLQSGFDAFQIRDIIEDSQGLVWVATKNHGFYLYDNRLQTFGLLGTSSGDIQLSENNVMEVFQASNKDFYIGTRQGGLNVIDHTTNKVRLFKEGMNGLDANRIESIIEDRHGNIWIGTILGLSKFNPSTKTFENFKLIPVRNLHIDSRDNFWVGTGHGVYLFDPDTEKFHKWSPEGFESFLMNNCTAILEDRQANMWFGTMESGVLKYLPDRDSLIHYHQGQTNPLLELQSNYVRSIVEDSQGRIWIGTRLGGVFIQQEPKGPFELAVEQLKKTSVFAIQEEPANVFWFSTNNGIYKYDSKTGHLENYGVKYGVQGEVFTSGSTYKTADGTVFFGGNNGLNFFKPEKVKKQHYVPQINFKSVETFGNELAYVDQGRLIFNYGSQISFDFFLSDYTAPLKNNYEYQLEGVNSDWINLGARNQISFANMNPGDYSLKIRGSNSDGINSQNEAEIWFTISDPWWLTSWAKAIYVIIALAVLYLIYRALMFRARKQHELQVLQIEKDKSEQLSLHKLRFFTNISHELRTPLTVMLPSAEKFSEYKKDKDVAARGKTMLRNITTLMNLIEELLEFRKIEQGHVKADRQNIRIVSQCRAIYEEFLPLAEEKRIHYHFHAPPKDFSILIDMKIMGRVIRNLLSNAFKYTSNGDDIEFNITLINNTMERELEIVVSDTGVGIPKQALPHIFDRFYRSEKQGHTLKGAGIGLELAKSLVTLHQGTIEVESKEGEGTIFTVRIPVGFVEEHDEIQHEVLEILPETTLDGPDKKMDDLHEIRLLVVEDDQEIQDLLVDVFSSKYHVQLASNGKEGLDMANQIPQPNIIISDIMMPEINGLELCNKLKSNYKTSHIPVILLTAKSTTKDQLSGIEIGADDYITKPFYTKLLVSKVENILERQSRLKSYFERELQIQPHDPPAYNKEKELLAKCTEIIEKNIDNQEFGVENLSHELGMSRTHLFRKLKYLIDQSPMELIYSIRMKAAMKLLESGNFSVSEVGYKTGFSSPSSFTITFKKYYGNTPKQFIPKHPESK